MAEPEQKIIREGDPSGSPSVLFDPEKRCNYHLNRRGERVYHGVPDGHEFDPEGELVPLAELPNYSAENPADPPLAGEPLKVPAGTVLGKIEPLKPGAKFEVGLVAGAASIPASDASADGSPDSVKEGESHV